MAFSKRAAKPAAAPVAAPVPAPAKAAAEEEDSDEVQSLDGDGEVKSQNDEEWRKNIEKQEAEARAKAIADAKEQMKQKAAEAEAAKRRQVLEEARRKTAEDAQRRAEEAQRRKDYEYEKQRQETIARSKAEAARRATGGGAGFGAGAAGGGFGSRGGGGGGGGFAWKKNQQAAAGAAAGPQGARSGQSLQQRFQDQPGHDECEDAISAMISRTASGMKEGLTILGIPSFPLVFIPGHELKVCGHNVREEVNEMICAWMENDKEEFYNCLVKVKGIVANPILTEEEMEMMEEPGDWKKFVGPDGRTYYTRKEAEDPPGQQADDDDDDEVVDLEPDGSVAQRTAPAAQAAPAQSQPAAPVGGAAPPGADGVPDDDYYGLLGVAPGASLHEIRTKFRGLVITEHPEKGGDPKKFARLNKAYSVLSDQKKRQEYDQTRCG